MYIAILFNIIGAVAGAIIGWLLFSTMYWKWERITYKKSLKENLYLIPVGFAFGFVIGTMNVLIISFI